MAYPLGFGFRPSAALSRALMSGKAKIIRPVPAVSPVAPSPVANARTGPSSTDVLRSLYGSVAKGRAVQAASAAEAQQRSAELTAQARTMRRGEAVAAGIMPPHAMLPDIPESRPAPPPIVPMDAEDRETDGEVIEEIAEDDAGNGSGDSEFSGWGMGMEERPVGVTRTLREIAPFGHVRRAQVRRQKDRRFMLKDKAMIAMRRKLRLPSGIRPVKRKKLNASFPKMIPPSPVVTEWRT